MPKMTGARFLAETLKGHGVTHVFFVPAILKPGLDELKNSGIRPILAHSEKAAAYMADGYARAAHGPGVCMAQSVGAANLASGLQDAYLGLSPVIALTGHRPTPEKYKHCYQEIEHTLMFAPVTKFSAVADKIEGLPFTLRQAFREVTSGVPAPVHLDIPGIYGEILMEATSELEVMIEEQFSHYPAFRPEPETERVQEAARILSQSQRPVIVAGGGVIDSSAQEEIVQLAEMLSIPVATSLRGKGSILENHPLSIGVVGSYSRRCANRIVSEADLVLFIGSRTGSQVTFEWRIPAAGTPVIQIDIDPLELGRNYPAEVSLLGDAKVTLKQLIKVSEPAAQTSGWLERVHQLVNEWRAEVAPFLNSNASPIRPERVCKELTEFLPSDAILVVCTGHAATWTGTMVELKQPGQSYLRAAGSLGWGFPASLGAKCAAPERPVICFTGDGGLWYHIAELETAVRHGINVIVVLNNNHSLNQVSRFYADQPDTDDLWQFTNVDLSKIAETIGCFSAKVEDPAELRNALDAALASGRPAVIDVISDIKAIATPPWGG